MFYLSHNLTDQRDNRGKRHDLAFVMTCTLLAICSGKVLIAEIARFLGHYHVLLCQLLDHECPRPVSGPQLRRILSSVDAGDLEAFHSRYLAFRPLSLSGETGWIGFDGKDLRGSIDAANGQKRNLCLVRAYLTGSSTSFGSRFYQGEKDSEIVEVRQLLEAEQLCRGNLTFDALHCQVETLDMVEGAGGTYVVQLKNNQRHLLEDVKDQLALCRGTAPVLTEHDKGHGRTEVRHYRHCPIELAVLDGKWKGSGIGGCVEVQRETEQLKTGKKTSETAYYLTNGQGMGIGKLAEAIRGHWGIESDNWVRDVTLREDRIKCAQPERLMVLSVLVSTANSLLRRTEPVSVKAKCEEISYCPEKAIELFNVIPFL
jgi:predicted transposase YbfD/YdcC